MGKIIAIVLAISVISGVLFWKFAPNFSQTSEDNGPVTLNVWGFAEDEMLIKPIIEAYKKERPNVTIKFTPQNLQNYRLRVQTQIANNQGPDVFIIHNSWAPMFIRTNTISSAPETLITMNDINKDYYPIVKDTLTFNNRIYALPRGVDGLALIYNEDILKSAGVSVPQTWEQFREAAIKTTVVGADGKIKTAGAGMGTTNNVDYWSDILGLLFFQQLVNPETPNTSAGAEVIEFYTSFTKDPSRSVWSKDLEPSTQLFKDGRLTFLIAPSSMISYLKQSNPTLNFKTAALPQLASRYVSYGSFWAYAVSNNSQYKDKAWDFVTFLTSEGAEYTYNQEALKTGRFPLPYGHKNLQKELSQDALFGIFAYQGPFYKSWYLSSGTLDQGINDEMIKLFQTVVDGNILGQSALSGLGQIAPSIQEILSKHRPAQ